MHVFSPNQTRSIQWNHAKMFADMLSKVPETPHEETIARSCDYWRSKAFPYQLMGSVSENPRTLCGAPAPNPCGPRVDGLVPVRHHCLVPALHPCGRLCQSLVSHHVLLLGRLQKAGFIEVVVDFKSLGVSPMYSPPSNEQSDRNRNDICVRS